MNLNKSERKVTASPKKPEPSVSRPKWLPPRKRWPPCYPTLLSGRGPTAGRGPRTIDQSRNDVRRAPSLSFARSLDIRPSARLFVLLPTVRSAATQDLFPVQSPTSQQQSQ
jgi:hypothetical protein